MAWIKVYGGQGSLSYEWKYIKKCAQNAMATIRPSVLTAFSHLEDQAEISIINPRQNWSR